jgi:hypothetical protein
MKNEMGGTCSVYGGEESCIHCFGGKLRERGYLENPGTDRKVVLK